MNALLVYGKGGEICVKNICYILCVSRHLSLENFACNFISQTLTFYVNLVSFIIMKIGGV